MTLSFPLTISPGLDYSLSAGSNLSVGFDSPVQRRTSRHSCGFFIVRHIMATLYGRAVWEGPSPAGSFARSVNPHGSAHPFDRREAEIINRLQRSLKS